MTAPSPVLPDTVRKLGPGLFTIGEVGDLTVASCLVNSITLTPSVDVTDPQKKLCGNEREGDMTVTWTLEGNVDTDVADDAGLFALSINSSGARLPFSFQAAADGPLVTGELQMTPLPYGGSDMGTTMTADFSWRVMGTPTFDWAPVTP